MGAAGVNALTLVLLAKTGATFLSLFDSQCTACYNNTKNKDTK